MILTSFECAELCFEGDPYDQGEWFECNHPVWRYFYVSYFCLKKYFDIPKNSPLTLVVHDEPGDGRISVSLLKQGPILHETRPSYADYALVVEGKDICGVPQQCYDVVEMLCTQHKKNTLYIEVLYE